ncbi:acyl-CoA dehydrogenase [Desulfoluna butyratoxydans]|uniref:3-methylmercaptopropionyl-CoA dehydrogenase n=1 Tax=Desulfoluna butyratoxydans TaxID=231438 RepID=A0A4U8YT43_9BACT|nr:acyl-CoA dehydrogenase [Desulfoluna butyratoxydans]VFQ46529.1 acyl-coa dehydrogenase/oxidase c-terminal [Desulfoluna butyratoxydans]
MAAQYVADRRDIDFVLFDQFDAESLTHHPIYADFNRKTFEMVINEARKFALKELLPTYGLGDRQGVQFDRGTVTPPECFRRPFELFREGEWLALSEEPEVGGQGLPFLVSNAAGEYLIGTNFAFSSYAMLGHGAGKMIERYGTEHQKDLFMKKLYSGEWTGTMLLTEPDAGSDVGALTTSATPNDDGTWSIYGTKAFITSGDHDLTDNIIHPVLARIEGAPAGTKGISIFLVPKIWVNEDGSLGEPNDIVCTGIEEKMGLHGSATCSMSLGSKGTCRGLLLGEANKGMRIMFTMMNEARLGVGIQAFSHASAAYLLALEYARTRKQGRAVEEALDPTAPSVPIIDHPDVRRMLLEMKCCVDGMRSFAYYIALLMDHHRMGASPDDQEMADDLVGLLTPVLKAYNGIKGYDVCTKAIQVYGGAGYLRDYTVEQISRDCKIASIYEGTDGIQAMDLLARKLGMKKGQVFMELLARMNRTVEEAAELDATRPLTEGASKLVSRLGDCAMAMGKSLLEGNLRTAFAHSVPFLEIMGDAVMAWMLLWRAVAAARTLKSGAKKKDIPFYNGQIKGAEFFFSNLLPVTMGKMEALTALGDAAVTMEDKGFGG